MNIENFEKRAQSEFEGFRPEVDTDQIWQNIEPHLKKKKKRRLFILFFWGLGIGLLLLSLWMFNPSKSSLQADDKGSNTIPVHGLDSEQHKEHPKIQDISAITHASQAVESSSSGPVQNSHIGLTQKQKGQEKPSSTPFRSASAPENTAQQPMPEVEHNLSAATSQENTYPADIQSLAQNPSKGLIPETAPVAKISADQDTALLESKVIPLESNPTKNTRDTQQPESKTAKNKGHAKSKIKPHKRKQTRQTLLVSTGVALPLKMLKPNGRVEVNEALLANRKASEKSLEALTADVRYAYTTPKGWMFMAGLNYKRFNEKFKVSYTEKERKIITGVLTQTEDALGQVVAQTTGPKEVTTTHIYSNVVYNHYQYLNLPLGMGYHHWNRRNQWELSGGLDLNLWFHFKGTQYNASGVPVASGDPWNTATYKRNTGFGMWASYAYSRNLSRNVRWQVAAKACVPFSNITSADYALTQKYYTIGLQGGLIFNLIKEPKSKHKKRRPSESQW